MSLTSDRFDPRLTHGVDTEPAGMAEVYLVLSDEERAKGFVRPVRRSYVHDTCGAVTTMGVALAETYARNPQFYGATYCAGCQGFEPDQAFHILSMMINLRLNLIMARSHHAG